MRLLDDEELIGSTELARSVSPTLDKAASRPVTVRRDRGADITLVSRDTWLRSRRAEQLEQVVLAVALATAERFARRRPTYPAELHWLAWLDDDDYLEFCREFVATVRTVIAGRAAAAVVADMTYAWEQTALALRDPHLMERLTAARGTA